MRPNAALAVGILIYFTDSRCGSPGDSGGCEMGIASTVMLAVPAGAAFGLIVGIIRAVRARAQTPR